MRFELMNLKDHARLAVFTLSIAITAAANAELPTYHEDAAVVERADLIVVGHLRPGTIKKFMHDNGPGGASSWEHQALLVITDVLKGQTDKKEMLLAFQYGISARQGRLRATSSERATDPALDQIIEIHASDHMGFEPYVADAREDHIYMLRRVTGGIRPHYANEGLFRVRDDEDIRPLSWKDYLLAYLAPNPEHALLEILKTDPGKASRTDSYFDYRALQRARAIEDPAQRARSILPFFLKGLVWQHKRVAEPALVECGPAGGEVLEPHFFDLPDRFLRLQIPEIWVKTGHRGALPLLVERLEKSYLWWQEDRPTANWKNHQPSSELTRDRSWRSSIDGAAAWALGELGDPEHGPLLRRFRNLWITVEGPDSRTAGVYTRALQALGVPFEE